MSTIILALERSRVHALARAADYVELTKPKIAALVLVTVAVAALLAHWGHAEVYTVLSAMFGTALVAASASALNQWLECRTDRLMPRTAERPLPAGRLSSQEVLVFAGITLAWGTVHLALFTNADATAWALASWIIYVLLYTPLKSRSSWNTAVGAVGGALPVVIGWTAAGGAYDLRLAALYGIVFLWQFPHFMAIAWLYRKQYAAANLQMLTVVDPSGRRAGVQAVLAALALLPVSLLPVLNVPGAGLYALAAFTLGLVQFVAAISFWRQLSETSARLLLRATLVYLPLLLALLLLFPFV